MKSLSGVGLGLSLVFGCLLLALVAELYYLLWWKKRKNCKRSIENGFQMPQKREFFYMFCCWKKPFSSLKSTTQELCSSILVHEPQSNSNKDLWLNAYGDESIENFPGPPRLLFTITEETKEDLESEDGIIRNGKQSTSRSLSDLLHSLETPFLTPLASPQYFTPPLTPSYNDRKNFDPVFESKSDAAFNKLRSSPPPKFKFLRDAEEKLVHRRKFMEEIEKGVVKIEDQPICSTSMCNKDEVNGPFITIIVANSQEEEISQHIQNVQELHFSSSSQLLPLVSSPPTFKTTLQQQTRKSETP